MFFEQLSFSKLITPITLGDFFSQYFGVKTAILNRHNSAFYDGLLSEHDLDQLLFHWPNEATVVEANTYSGMRQNLHGKLFQQNTATILNELDQGSTLIFDRLDQRIPSLTRMCAQFERELHYPFQANVYITPAGSQGFKPHFDDHHVFILQTTGSKHWRIDTEAKPYGTPDDKALDYGIDPINHLVVELQQGDMLYIPPYTVHEATTQNTPSVHVTMSPFPPTTEQLLNKVLQYSTESIASLRQALPPGYLLASDASLSDTIRQSLSEISTTDISALIARFKSDSIDAFRGTYHGALQQRIAAYSDDDLIQAQFQPNRELLWLRRDEPDEICIKCPHATLRFPMLFESPINFCLTTDSYTLSDIPDMSHAEKLVLLRRLCSEALIRKTA